MSSASKSYEHEHTERLAFQYWEERGCPAGDALTDWLRAEAEVRRQRELAARL